MTPTELLFGKFPRTVAASGVRDPNQHHVFSEGEFDAFLDEVREKRNVYSSISQFPLGGEPVTDKVPFDFDSPYKESSFPPTYNDCQKIEEMRDDPWLTSKILGDVLADAKKVAKYAVRRNIPSLAVFSGLGLHYYLMCKPEEDAKDEIRTTNRKLTDELDLQTSDTVVAQPERILRVPNCRRVDSEAGESVLCDIWTIPIHPKRLLEMSSTDLLETAKNPNWLELDEEEYAVENRPEMQVYEDYINVSRGPIQTKELDEIDDVSDGEIKYILEEQIKMPCISERVKQRNPSHNARFVFAVALFNKGYSVEESVDIIRKLNWIDFDEEKTRSYLEQVHNHGYGRWSCRTLMNKGLCVHSDNPSECPSFMKPGEECKWK